MKFNEDLGKVAITFEGEWYGRDYERLSLVTYNGNTYLSIADNKNVVPGTDGSVWLLLGGGTPTEGGNEPAGGGDTPGTIGTGDTIGVAYHSDGLLYWTRNGQWLLGPDGNMVRAQGIDGRDGADGKDGKDGTDATEGSGSSSAGAARFKSIVFRRYNGTPAKPSGGSFDNPVPSLWSDGVPAGEERLWTSSRWFFEDDALTAATDWTTPAIAGDSADIQYKWSAYGNPGNPDSNPSYWHDRAEQGDKYWAVRKMKNGVWGPWDVVKIEGETGQTGPVGPAGPKGADGTSVRILGTKDSESELPVSDNTTGDGYLIYGELWVWDGDSWENCGSIQGPAGTSQYVYFAFSNDGGQSLTNDEGRTPGKYIAILVTTSDTRPTLTSDYAGKWTKFKGDDGFGYEFIYKVSPNPEAPLLSVVNNETRSAYNDAAHGQSKTEDEFVPYGWTDDPGTLSTTNRYLWMCYRKKGESGWGNFRGNGTTATLFGYLAKDGSDGADGATPNTSFKSIVFRRSNSDISEEIPNGGNYNSPIPTDREDPNDNSSDLLWSDGIPEGDAKLWMSTRIFSSDGEAPQQPNWTTPRPVADTADLDFMFSSEDNPGEPNKDDPAGEDTTGKWSETESSSTQYMAYRKIKGGEYDGPWIVLHVKGEKGEDGTSVRILGSKEDASQLPQSNNTEGDAYIIDGDLYVWDGDNWVNVGGVKGEPGEDGKSPVLHIKYSNDNGANFTDHNGETPGDYIGLYWDYTAADSDNPASYAPWRYVRGEDGFGYEWIYFRTETDQAPTADAVNAITSPAYPNDGLHGQVPAEDDFVPLGWTDDLVQPNVDYPYAWKMYRKKTNGVWGDFRGTVDGVAALENQYYAQPNGIVEVVEYYLKSPFASGITPDGGDENFPEFDPDEEHPEGDVRYDWSTDIPTLDARYKYLWNKEEIRYTNGDVIPTTPSVIGVYGIGSRIKSITEYYLATSFANGVQKNNGAWGNWVERTPPAISGNRPYLWNYEKIVYENEDSSDTTTFATEPAIIGHYGHDGRDGATGNGVSEVVEHYLASPRAQGILVNGGDDTNNIDWWDESMQGSFPETDAVNKYLWNYETIIYTNGDQVDSIPCVIGVFGEDGRGITSVDEYYLATDYPNGVSNENGGWGTWTKVDAQHPVPTIDSQSPYLWNYEVINYNSGEPTKTFAALIGVYGSATPEVAELRSDMDRLKNVFDEDTVSLENGAILRNFIGVTEENDQHETVVKAMLNASDLDKDPEHGRLMIAAGMQGLGQPQNAKAKIYEDGHAEFKHVVVEGEVHASSGSFTGDVTTDNILATGGVIKKMQNPFVNDYDVNEGSESFDGTPILEDNDTVIANFGGLRDSVASHVLKLPAGPRNSGRRLIIVGTFALKQDYYKLRIHGRSVNYAEFYNEVIELFGVGDSSNFIAWHLVSREPRSNEEGSGIGRPMPVLAYGRTNVVDPNNARNKDYVDFVKCGTFDGSQIYISKRASVLLDYWGVYYLDIPKSWFKSADDIMCMCNGYGAHLDASGSNTFASVSSVTADPPGRTGYYRLEIHVAEDNSTNHGAFQFMIYNLNQW